MWVILKVDNFTYSSCHVSYNNVIGHLIICRCVAGKFATTLQSIVMIN